MSRFDMSIQRILIEERTDALVPLTLVLEIPNLFLVKCGKVIFQ